MLNLQDIQLQLDSVRATERALEELFATRQRVAQLQRSLAEVPPDVLADVDALYTRAARAFGVTELALRSSRRPRHLSEARMAVAYAARQLGHGCDAIGRAMSLHYTTVIYAEQRIANLITTDPRLHQRVQTLLAPANS